MVLSLGGTAALARTSNMISASSGPDADGNFYCLEFDTGFDSSSGAGVYDLGLYPSQAVYAYPADIRYRSDSTRSADSSQNAEFIEGDQMCAKGGLFYYNQGRDTVYVGTGGQLVSASAMLSVGLTAELASSISIDQ